MKEKIIAAFKVKFPTVNLSKIRLDAMAAKLEGKITDEAEIDAKLDDLNEIMPFSDIAKADDRIADLDGKLKKALGKANPENEKPTEAGSTEEKPKTDDSAPPAWAKGLIDDIQALKTEKAQTSIRSTISEKLKAIPEILWAKRAMPQTMDEVDAFVEDVQTDFKDLPPLTKKSIFDRVDPPKGGAPVKTGGGKEKPASKEELDAAMKHIKL